jgi:hypothetical protein
MLLAVQSGLRTPLPVVPTRPEFDDEDSLIYATATEDL